MGDFLELKFAKEVATIPVKRATVHIPTIAVKALFTFSKGVTGETSL